MALNNAGLPAFGASTVWLAWNGLPVFSSGVDSLGLPVFGVGTTSGFQAVWAKNTNQTFNDGGWF